jgi:hypothetical protein
MSYTSLDESREHLFGFSRISASMIWASQEFSGDDPEGAGSVFARHYSILVLVDNYLMIQESYRSTCKFQEYH